MRRGSLPLVYAREIFLRNPGRLKSNMKICYFFDFCRVMFEKETPPLQERGLMGQVLIHQCEKGKPPAGVCYRDFF